jgi:hypothetical protein
MAADPNDVRLQGKTGSSRPTTKMTRWTLNGHWPIARTNVKRRIRRSSRPVVSRKSFIRQRMVTFALSSTTNRQWRRFFAAFGIRGLMTTDPRRSAERRLPAGGKAGIGPAPCHSPKVWEKSRLAEPSQIGYGRSSYSVQLCDMRQSDVRHCTLVLCPFTTVVRIARRLFPAIRPSRNPARNPARNPCPPFAVR